MPSLILADGSKLHPREENVGVGLLAAVNGQVSVDVYGCQSVAIDIRTTGNISLAVEGSIDEVNWFPLPVRSLNGGIYQITLTNPGVSAYVGNCHGFRKVRARCTAYTAQATVTLVASPANLENSLIGLVTPLIVTSVGAAAAAVTLTLPAVTGMRHYLTYLSINRFASAALAAAAAPVTVTTTNLPGSLAFSFGAEAFPQGSLDRWREDFAYPVAASAQGTATTIVCPATTGVIWRVTAGYYVNL